MARIDGDNGGHTPAVNMKAKSELLSEMSHDFRTPLNIIIGFAELMLEEVPGKINEDQRRALNDILNSAKRLLDLVNGMPEHW